ncbi:MAG: 50S ribosomal protein L11 methyltransferase [Crocinitomicaceae bacterium]|nr:50S ribosomal protein L11 methyltransferase [Crocinitomicaceae bacterium]
MNYFEVTFQLDPLYPARDVLVAQLAERGFESFVETGDGLKAYIAENEYHPEALDRLAMESIEGEHRILQVELIQDQNWNAEWEKNFDPIVVNDDCIVRAPFHSIEKKYEYDIIIEPKMSFGTGHHATTWLMMREMFHVSLHAKDVLDMGCGTAVLSILAEKRGAKSVLGIDIDQWAYENALENIERNNCQKIECLQGGAELLGKKKFDLGLANINRNILLKDAPALSKVIQSGGDLLLSGFYTIDHPPLIEAFSSFSLLRKTEKDEWTLLHLQKN